MKKFEYTTYNTELSVNQLNDLGLSRWELVSYTVIFYSPCQKVKHNYIFKREKL